MNLICKREKNIFFTLVVFCLAGGSAYAQNDKYGFNELQGLFESHNHKPLKYKSDKLKPKNETEFLLVVGFNSYKAFFSSQDNPSCVFYPSCSSYSVEAFQQKGLFLGTFYTFDRLSRCHHFIQQNQYIYDPEKQRYYDPIP